jgi:hypothetical protein
VYLISDKIKPYVDVTSSLRARCHPVPLKEHGFFVVLGNVTDCDDIVEEITIN